MEDSEQALLDNIIYESFIFHTPQIIREGPKINGKIDPKFIEAMDLTLGRGFLI